jgi:hypothetical protein
MAGKAVVEVEIKADKAQNTLGGLNEKLERLRKRLEDVEIGSEAFKKLQTQIQKASSEVKTLEKQMEGLEPQQKAEAFLKLGESIMGGFVVATGALAMFGAENEKIQQIQTRVQGAIAIAMGARMIAEGALYAATAKRVAIEKIAQLRGKAGIIITKAQALANWIWTGSQTATTVAISATSIALGVLRAAIIATGIGALAIGISAAVGAIGSWISGSDDAAEAQKKLAREADALTESIKNQLVEQQKQLDLARQLKNEDDDRKDKIITLNAELEEQEATLKSLNDATSKNIGIIKSLGVNTSELEAKHKSMQDARLKSIEAIKDEIEAQENLIETEDEVEDKRKKRSEDRKQRRKEEAKDLSDLQNEIALMSIEDDDEREKATIQQNRRIALESIKGAENEAQQKLIINQKYDILEKQRQDKIAEKNKGEDIMSLEDLLVKKAEMEQEYYDSKLSEEQILLNAVEDKYFTELELAKQFGLDTVDLERAKQAEIDQIKLDAKNKEIEENQEALDAQLEARVAFVGAVGNTIGELSGLFAEGTKASKAAAIAEIAINTGLGFIQGLDIAQKSAKATGPGAAIAFPIFYATQIAAVLGAVKKAKQALGAGGGGGASPPPIQSVAAPTKSGNFSLNNAGTNTPQDSVIKTFVVADEMSQEQAQLADIRRRSTI